MQSMRSKISLPLQHSCAAIMSTLPVCQPPTKYERQNERMIHLLSLPILSRSLSPSLSASILFLSLPSIERSHSYVLSPFHFQIEERIGQQWRTSTEPPGPVSTITVKAKASLSPSFPACKPVHSPQSWPRAWCKLKASFPPLPCYRSPLINTHRWKRQEHFPSEKKVLNWKKKKGQIRRTKRT